MARRGGVDSKDDPLGLNAALGLVLAGQPPGPLQPRRLRSAGRALGDRQGRGRLRLEPRPVDGRRSRRRLAPPPMKPDGPPHPARQARLHHACRRAGAACLPPRWPTGRCPNTTSRWKARWPTALSPQQTQPDGQHRPARQFGTSDEYPIVATTCRVSEHWQSGAMSRNLPWLVELVPDAFVEISKELAAAKGIANGDRVVDPLRPGPGSRSTRWSPAGCAAGSRRPEGGASGAWCGTSATRAWLPGTARTCSRRRSGTPTRMIPEYKAFLCDVELKIEN